MKAYLEILKLVWPLALGMINNAVMQFVDRAFLARESMSSLEAVLPATTLAWIFMSFFQSVVGYSGVFVAQYHGAGNAAGCRQGYRAGLVLSLAAGVLMLPLWPLGDWIFSMTSASPELAARQSAYYDIVILGGVFVYAQMAAVSYLTGRGKTRVVFWVNLLGNLLNIALDPLLIFTFGLGISGAAIATVFSQAVQVAVLASLIHRERTEASASGKREESVRLGELLRRILRFGLPSGGYEVLNMLSFTIFVFVTGRVGDIAFAVSNACFTVNYLLFAPMMGFAIGVQTLVGQARGRGDDAAAGQALRRTLHLGLGFVFVAYLVILALHGPILTLFAPAEAAMQAEFLSLGRTLVLLMSAWMLFDAADVILSGALRGAGDTRFVFWWMLICSFLVWMPLVGAALLWSGSIVVLWSTMVFYVVVIAAGTWVRWRGGRWKGIRVT